MFTIYLYEFINKLYNLIFPINKLVFIIFLNWNSLIHRTNISNTALSEISQQTCWRNSTTVILHLQSMNELLRNCNFNFMAPGIIVLALQR